MTDAASAPRALDEVVATFQRWLYLPDPGPLYAVLATIAANRLAGDPVWVLLVGPPSSGKTELLSPLAGLPDVHFVSRFTEAGLLSGSFGSGHGGLLQKLGSQGILVFKDFTSLLAESPNSRDSHMADLREIYDRHWTRHLGTGGGRTLEWFGKAGLLAGVTDEIELHREAMSTMGERFLYYRMPDVDALSLVEFAGTNVGRQNQMRVELEAAVVGFFADLDLDTTDRIERTPVVPELVYLADFAARCRSPVRRDHQYGRHIQLVPRPEIGARLYDELAQHASGLLAIGLQDDETWCVVRSCALDGIPTLRRKIIDQLAAQPHLHPMTRNVADEIDYPPDTVGRGLEDLTAHGIVTRESDQDGQPLWQLSHWTWKHLQELGSLPSRLP